MSCTQAQILLGCALFPVILFLLEPNIVSSDVHACLIFFISHFRGRPASSVSKSIGVLDLGKEKSAAKPPRRLSIQAKSSASPASRAVGTITPISEARAKRSVINQGKTNTPLSAVAKSSNGKEINRLFSALYWLSQIKLSESAAKHSISLGFFKLALEAGCEVIYMSHQQGTILRNI